MKDKESAQVVIVGAGPAGIIAALTLSARNISCILVDANAQKVDKPGECIPPNALPLFKQLGLDSLLKHPAHQNYYGNQSVWGSNRIEESLFLTKKHNQGVLLDRSIFEEQLRGLLPKSKSSFMTGYAFKKVVAKEKELIVTLQSKVETITLSCHFIIDATGRKASICRKLGRRKEQLDLLAALAFNCTIDEPIHKYVYTESTEKGWFYVAPLQQNEVSIMYFTDMDLLPNKSLQAQFICDTVNNTTLLKQLFKRPLAKDQIKKLSIHAANSTRIEKPYGENWLAIGDAAYSFDPVSSYGITSSMAAGYYGAHALADTLNGNTEAFKGYEYIMENAFQYYRIHLAEHYASEKRWTSSLFWKRRQQVVSL